MDKPICHGATALSPSAISEEILSFVERQLSLWVENYGPGLTLPNVFAGHWVAHDSRADFAHLLGLLQRAGRSHIAGVPIEQAIVAMLMTIGGAYTTTFSAFRVAETLINLGGLHENQRLKSLSEEERSNLITACDSTDIAESLRAGRFPQNFNVVLARCEHARKSLGILDDETLLNEFVERSRPLFDSTESGFMDDSTDRHGRFDIYSADIYLFAEPLADKIGPSWSRGLQKVLEIVGKVATKDGAAFVWGRSLGALSVCMTFELAGLGLRHCLVKDVDRWLGLSSNALSRLDDWFSDGVITAHQHRSQNTYRGPYRRLQMTFDCLAKLVQAALDLRETSLQIPPSVGMNPFSCRDELIRLTSSSLASLWAYRSNHLAFTLPFVGSVESDYVASPRNPGLFEVPVDIPLWTGVPFTASDGRAYVAAGLPALIRKSEGGVEVEYRGFLAADQRPGDEQQIFPGVRHALYRVDRRTLHVEEKLTFDVVPDALALQVFERAERPLHVEFESTDSHRASVVDVSGIREYRSFWGELDRAHQIDLEPKSSINFRWSVTPKLRIATSAYADAYHRSLYAVIEDDVLDSPLPPDWHYNRDALDRFLCDIDIFHLHWPEWLAGEDLARHQRLLDALRAARVKIVWTQHNLKPHSTEGGEAGYHFWAQNCDAALHHTRWSVDVMTRTYSFSDHTLHRVVPHMHWGHLFKESLDKPREEIERDLKLPPCTLRLGLIGAPRKHKDVQLALDAFHACHRDEFQLLVCSPSAEIRIPDDSRIIVARGDFVPRELYDQRLRTIDVLIFPFASSGMLTTGTVGDAIAHGIPALVSDWPYLKEALGAGGIPYGSSREELTSCLNTLDRGAVQHAAEISRSLQSSLDQAQVAAQFLEALEDVGTDKL